MRELVSLNIAVVAVGEAPTQAVVERLGGAGHTIAQLTQLDDSVQIVRGKLLEHVADSGIDVVIVVAGLKTETTGAALQPLVTRPLTGFSDLLRMIAFQEIGSAAMLVDAEAAQCKSTFVFVLPANASAIKLALDRLIVPQLDYRTKPRNVVMALPRVGHAESDTETDEAPAAAPDSPAPWITTRGPGEGPVPSMFPPRTSVQMPIARKSMQMASVAEVVEKTAASVSQRMPSAPTPALGVGVVSAHQSPPPVPPRITKTLPVPTIPHEPPPVPRGKVNTTLPTPLTNKAPAPPVSVTPAKVVALSTLLPEPAPAVAAISDAPPAVEAAEPPPAAEAPAPEPAAAAGAVSVSDAVPTPVGEDVGSAPGDKAINGAHVNGHVNGHASARKMISLAELEAEDREAADERVDELDNDVAEIVDEPKRDEESRGMIVRAAGGSTPPSTTPYNETSGMMRSASPSAPPKDEPRGVIVGDEDEVSTAPARRVAAASTPPDDEPRRYAEPRRRDRKPLVLALIGILALGTVTVAGVIALSRHDDRTAQAAPPEPAMPSPQEPIATAKDEPPAGEPPAANPAFGQTPAEALDGGVAAADPVAVEPAQPPPAEIDMGTPDPNATAPKTTPRAPRPPKEAIEKPAQDPADALANAPINKTEDGCDEVSCILDKYKQACCARFKPPEPEPIIEKPTSGLPEKLDKLMVQEGIAAVKPAVIACGENNGIHGTVKLQVRVSPAGKPLDVAVALTPDNALGACVAAAVKLARFTETDEGGSFGYPFVF